MSKDNSFFPVLLYAAEWTVNKEDGKRLLAFEMRCYRSILALKWQDRITNEEIRAVVQRKETVVDTIRMRKLEAPTVWAYLQDAR